MNGNDHVRSTMRRGFRAYFAACMPTAQTSVLVEIATEHDRRSSAQRRRRQHRLECQSPLPQEEPVKGFFSLYCEGNGLPDCAVCFDKITAGQKILSLRCSDTTVHSFHENCIMPWLRDKGTCPICRAEIV